MYNPKLKKTKYIRLIRDVWKETLKGTKIAEGSQLEVKVAIDFTLRTYCRHLKETTNLHLLFLYQDKRKSCYHLIFELVINSKIIC